MKRSKKWGAVILLVMATSLNVYAGDYACFRCDKATRLGFQGVDSTRTVITCDLKRVYTLQTQHYRCIKQKGDE